ncbi:MAG: hypothetical protein WBF79_04795 [Rhodococcus sp. (in: high G+C Gram-positive bacteria)]
MSEGGFFSVEHEAVKAHGSTLQDSVSKFQSHSTEFESAMDDLLGRIEGGAKPALEQLKSAWVSAAAQVNTALGQLGGRVDTAAGSYRQGEADQADYVTQQGNSMDFHAADVRI